MDNQNTTKIKTKSTLAYWVIVIAVIALIATIVLAVLQYHSQQKFTLLTTQSSQQFAAQTQQLAAQAKQIKQISALQKTQDNAQNLQTLFTKKLSSIQQSQTNLNQMRSQLATLYQTNLNQLNRTKTAYQANLDIINANYLGKLANDKLQYEYNIPASITLLTAAKTALVNNNTQLAISTKQTITLAIKQLEKLPLIHKQAIYLKLTAIDNMIMQLPIISMPQAKLTDTKKSNAKKTWRESLHNSWESLKDIVVIRHNDQNSAAFIPQNKMSTLLQNLHESIAQAQLALLQHDNKIYHDNLTRTTDWLNKYFDKENNSVQQIITALNNLNAINIDPNLPELSNTLQALSALQTNKDQ